MAAQLLSIRSHHLHDGEAIDVRLESDFVRRAIRHSVVLAQFNFLLRFPPAAVLVIQEARLHFDVLRVRFPDFSVLILDVLPRRPNPVMRSKRRLLIVRARSSRSRAWVGLGSGIGRTGQLRPTPPQPTAATDKITRAADLRRPEARAIPTVRKRVWNLREGNGRFTEGRRRFFIRGYLGLEPLTFQVVIFSLNLLPIAHRFSGAAQREQASGLRW